MGSKRGNPVMGKGSNVALSQSVNTPVGDSSNTDKGNPASMRVPAGKARKLNQSVGHPSARKPG